MENLDIKTKNDEVLFNFLKKDKLELTDLKEKVLETWMSTGTAGK